ELTRSLAELKGVMEEMGTKLGARVDDHERQLAELTKQLQAINARGQSVVQAVDRMQQELASQVSAQGVRVEDQERRLEEMQGMLEAVPALQKGLATAVEQSNELTRSLAELKGVMEEMGTKLGARVDDHERQLAELTRQLQVLGNSQQGSLGATTHSP
ncbi:MAG: hypothetical protein D6704_12365, partial [Nitrospirae bacterium]